MILKIFLRYNKELIDSEIFYFFKAVDSCNKTNFCFGINLNSINETSFNNSIHNFKIEFFNNEELNAPLIIPEGYSHILKKVLAK